MRSLHARVAALREVYANSEVSLWPTCLLCTEASYAKHPELGHAWVPVEGYRRDPGPGKYHAPTERGTRGYFDIIVECHGDVQAARVHVPWWWGNAHELKAIQELLFFGPDKYPDHGLVTRVT